MQKHGEKKKKKKDERTVRKDPMGMCVLRLIVEPIQGPHLKVKYKKKNMVIEGLIANDEAE